MWRRSGSGRAPSHFAALLKEELGLFWEKIAGLTAWPRVAVTPTIALERIAPSRGGEVVPEVVARAEDGAHADGAGGGGRVVARRRAPG